MPDEMTTSMLAEFAERLVRTRAARGYTQSAFARALGLRAGRVHCWESGRNYPTVLELQRVCQLLRVTSDWLYFGQTSGLTTEAYRCLHSD